MSSIAPASPQIGSTIGGKYRLIRLLGCGGMGAVYEAENTFTHKHVAIKWMHADVASEPEHAARLMREAQAAARVRHPNVVDVYDVGREGEALFLVMEFLEGEPLTDLIERGGMPVHKLIALLLPAMRGVAAAHRAGVIHRDIKPDNIFLARETDTALPVPKVLDFGISKLDARGAEQLSLTKTGSTMGTPMYMSYEQLTGVKDIDVRTDIYAFGVVLYEAVTGRSPFEAQSFPELAIKIATSEPIAPKLIRPDLPTALEKLIQWAMAKDRAARIGNMDALIQELEPFATEHGFRAQMTLAAGTLPELPSAARGDAVPEHRDSMGRFSTPMGGTIPSQARGQAKRPVLWVAAALAAILTVGAGLTVLRGSALKGAAVIPAPALPTRKPSRVDSVPATVSAPPAPVSPPLEAPLAQGPSESEDGKVDGKSSAAPEAAREPARELRARKNAKTAAPVAPTASAVRSESESVKLELRAPTAQPIEAARPAEAPVDEKDFRAGRPKRGQF